MSNPGSVSTTSTMALGDGQDRAPYQANYACDDYVDFDFTDVQDYYVVGLSAYLANTSIPNLFDGWGLFKHNQANWPTFLAFLAAVMTIPVELPSFEAKFMRCYSDQNCWIRFGGPSNVQHYIPQNTWVEFRRRTNMIFVVRDTINGSMRISFYG